MFESDVHFQISAIDEMPILGIFEQITEGLQDLEHKRSFG